MSFSFTNPDVDPLSLSERVRKLESRLGPGGSGGAFVGSIPDFDQYPDNAIKVTNDGMILKLSIDDIRVNIGLAEAGGVGLKCCGFLPYWGGVLGGPALILARFYYKNNLSGIPGTTNKSASKVVPFDTADWVDRLHVPGGQGSGVLNVLLGVGGKNITQVFGISLFNLSVNLAIQQNTSSPPVLSKNEAVVSVNAYSPTDTRNLTIEGNTYSFGAFWGLVPDYFAWMGAGKIHLSRYPQDIGFYNSGANFFVKNLQQVPPIAHQTFPASWLV